MPVWGVVNQKGGVGKTTTSVNLAAGLALKGQKTLIVDCDPQGNATVGLTISDEPYKITLYDVLASAVEKANETVAVSAIHKISDHLDLLPATLELAGAEALLLGAVGKEMILRDALSPLREHYDWIILDAPPSLGLLTINVLCAVDAVLVPMQCEYYALEGLSQLVKTIELVKRRINPALKIEKVLMTMVDNRNRLTQQVEEEVVSYFGDRVSPVKIPRNVRLSEAPSFGEPAITRFPSSKGAEAYTQFVNEVLSECGVR